MGWPTSHLRFADIIDLVDIVFFDLEHGQPLLSIWGLDMSEGLDMELDLGSIQVKFASLSVSLSSLIADRHRPKSLILISSTPNLSFPLDRRALSAEHYPSDGSF
ncbi:hypothetical protein L3X38_043240 [Prunus dulcis]|uniref:Uncharacterized protein n=1 Tax=Prunus dulcis TaxID=3755 RepID=A0AAD4YMA0_PRUDU|nr:hypothetical protein L3X38_043240 [Prunus dulcis]